ncbi:MAG: 16S rRNA (cytosine(967)-C(5))-methyltransferase RsmB [Rhodanobacteraceae bacterium]|nr:16S rRNA (cytosine(967)-C(5))-methyltransferase RsmB [Rhodanobacteraceae bacterium]MBP9154416.1 16S rRNA (cytosine(967)-C(5))-methyltransferase RsmB [Xanthomonadales bacterium]HQW81706.1 16S rRNA (cytosine(967)-C(5))-methyltransferase RsmB [Pseudomonadota bacterium]
MKRTLPIRAVAAQTLASLRRGGASLTDLLTDADTRIDDARDRAQLRAILYASLRGIFRYEALLRSLLTKPLPRRHDAVEALLINGLAQLELGIDAAYAVVDASVTAARALGETNLAGLVNAVLRRFQREREALLAALPATPEISHNHPAWMIRRFEHDWGTDASTLFAANNAPAPTWLRVHRQRRRLDQLQSLLSAHAIEAAAFAHLPDALRIDQGLDVTQLPGFAEGEFSVQDGAAQLAVELLDLRPGLQVLDACCAPGGKLAHMAEREPGLASLVGVDIDAARVARTRSGLARLHIDAELFAADLRQHTAISRRRFDRILLDAPCSGTGVIRRHPDIRLLRRDADIAALLRTQSELLNALWPLLAPGGRLVYATCSVLADENDGQVAAFLERRRDAQALDVVPHWFGVAQKHGRQNLSGGDGLDGFYYAVLAARD